MQNLNGIQALQLMVERFIMNRNPLFLIEPTLQTQLQVNGNNSWFYKNVLFAPTF